MVNNQFRNNNSNAFLFMLVLASCMMMGFTTASCGGCNSTITTATTTSVVQPYLEVIDMEIIELTCHQNRLSDALSVLKINSTLNSDIISMRTKQMQKITKAISLLSQESTFLKSSMISIISNNGQAFEYKDGTRAKSCLEYRNPIHRYQYKNEGSGLYNIEPSIGLVLTVYCDMTTDGGGWTLISGIRNDYAGIHFHTFEDSTAISTPTTFTSFHITTSALLNVSTQVRAAHDIAANPVTTFYQSSWSYSAYCTITQAFRNAIQTVQQNNPQHVSGDLPSSCVTLTGSFSAVPTHFTYGKSISGDSDPSHGHSIGFRMGIPHSYVSGHLMVGKSYGTYSFNGAPEGNTGNYQGVLFTFAVGESPRNGAVFLR